MRSFPLVFVLCHSLLVVPPVFAGDEQSDTTAVVFTPAEDTLVKGGASHQYTVTMNGTTNNDDNGWIRFKISEGDDISDDTLATIQVQCNPPLPQNTNFQATAEFTMKCTAEGKLVIDSVDSVVIIDPNTGEQICGDDHVDVAVGEPSDAETDHEVVIEDIPDGDNHGLLEIRCVDSQTPAVGALGLIALAGILAIAGAVLSRVRAS